MLLLSTSKETALSVQILTLVCNGLERLPISTVISSQQLIVNIIFMGITARGALTPSVPMSTVRVRIINNLHIFSVHNRPCMLAEFDLVYVTLCWKSKHANYANNTLVACMPTYIVL